MDRSNCKSRFVEELLKQLSSKVEFVILRGYQNLPDRITGDVDMMMSRQALPEFDQIIGNLKGKYDLVELKKIDRQYVLMYRLLHTRTEIPFGLKIDIHFRETWRGCEYISASQILKERIVINGYPVPTYEHQVVIGALQPVVGMRKIPPKRRMQLDLLRKECDISKLEASFARILGVISGHFMANLIIKGDYDTAESMSNSLRWSIAKRAINQSPWITVKSFAEFMFKNIRYRFAYPGAFIAIIGPDGAGKSTLIDSMTSVLKQLIINDRSKVIPWRPEYLPRLAKIKSNSGKDSLEKVQKQKYIPGYTSSFIRMCYYSADYLLGHFLSNRKVLSSEGYIIYDRYFEDFIVQPEIRSFIRLPLFVKRFFYYFIPRPDLVLYFRAEPAVLRTRKQEETLEELTDLVARYDDYAARDSRIVRIDASGTPLNVNKSVLELVAKRYG